MKNKNIICTIFTTCLGCVMGALLENKLHILKRDKKQNFDNSKYMKFKQYYNILNQWIWLQHNSISIESIFLELGYKKIAIYGMGEIGWRLFEELKNTEISVIYGIDNSLSEVDNELKIVTPEDELQQVDAIVVSSVFAFDEICRKLNSVTDIPVVSFETILFNQG